MTREKAIRFGATASMVGIVTEPHAGIDASEKPAVIFINSGIVHRVGACRLHTQIARSLAPAGVTSLRFDLSGIGDSDARRDTLSFEESSVIETREAMDYLASTKGIRKFVLAGLCSGADVAHLTAAADDRVTGLVMFDAWCYRNAGFYLRHYGPRLFKLSVWKNSIATRRAQMFAPKKEAPQATGDDVVYEMPRYVRVFPPKRKVSAELKKFAARKMNIYVVMTGGQEELYNHQSQYENSFSGIDFGGRLRVDFLKDATHIFTGLDHQEFLVREVGEWMRQLSAVQVRTPPKQAPLTRTAAVRA
jgi:pimeloyl-ACP methyl ester carboxylesterase